jgi:hypothetical protein
MSPKRVASRPGAKPRRGVQLKTAIVAMAVTSMFTVLLLMAYLNSGCHLERMSFGRSQDGHLR